LSFGVSLSDVLCSNVQQEEDRDKEEEDAEKDEIKVKVCAAFSFQCAFTVMRSCVHQRLRNEKRTLAASAQAPR